jgi:hypothetical protein
MMFLDNRRWCSSLILPPPPVAEPFVSRSAARGAFE